MSGPQTRSKTRAPCEEVWAKGMPLKVTTDGFPIVMKPSKNCEFVVKGTSDLAYVGYPEDPKDLVAYLKEIPTKTAKEFEDAPDGVYTWLFWSTKGSPPTFAATRTLHDLELGTVHYALATALGATHVHGAGEVWKHGSLVTFNFLSGTFMEKWELPKDCPLETMQEFLKMKLKETFPYLVSAKEITFLPKGETFITQRYLGGEVTTEELIEWTDAGFKVCLHGFDPEKPKDRDRARAQCKSTRATCQKPFTVLQEDRMRGGAPPTPRKPQREGETATSQFEEAKRMLAFGQVARPEPTATAPVPESKLSGMGGRKRKTKKAKTARRKTRRRVH